MRKTVFAAAACFAFSANASELITNIDDIRPKAEVVRKQYDKAIYDLSFPAYDKAFADDFGLESRYVTEMDKGLRYMEIRIITESSRTNCYYNMVLDKKGLELDFPEQDYVLAYKPVLTYVTSSKTGNTPQTKAFTALRTHNRWENSKKFLNRTYFGNPGYSRDAEGYPIGSHGGAGLQYFIQSRHPDYYLISVIGDCNTQLIYDYPKPSFWIRKKGRKEYVYPKAEDHYLFEIPKKIRDETLPYIREMFPGYKRRSKN